MHWEVNKAKLYGLSAGQSGSFANDCCSSEGRLMNCDSGINDSYFSLVLF